MNGSVDKVIAASERRVSDPSTGVFIYNLNPPIENGGPTCTSGVLASNMAQTSDRKSFHTLEFDRLNGFLRKDGSLSGVIYGNVQETRTRLHFTAQKKNLFGWGYYSTRYLCKRLVYSDAKGTNIDLYNLFSDGDYRDWYYQFDYARYVNDLSLGEPTVPPQCNAYINNFYCEATSRGYRPYHLCFFLLMSRFSKDSTTRVSMPLSLFI